MMILIIHWMFENGSEKNHPKQMPSNPHEKSPDEKSLLFLVTGRNPEKKIPWNHYEKYDSPHSQMLHGAGIFANIYPKNGPVM